MKKIIFTISLSIVWITAFSHASAGTTLVRKSDMVRKNEMVMDTGKQKKIITELDNIQKALIKISKELDHPHDDAVIDTQLNKIQGSETKLRGLDDPLIHEELFAYFLFTDEFIDRENDRIPLKPNETIPYQVDFVLRQTIYTYGEQTRNFKFFIEALNPTQKSDQLLKAINDSIKQLSKNIFNITTRPDLNNAKDEIIDTINGIKDKIKSVDDKAKIIKVDVEYLKNQAQPIPSSRFIIGATAYANNIYGINFFIRFKKEMDKNKNETDITQYIGGQFVFPVKSRVTGNSYAGQSGSTTTNDGKVAITTAGTGTGTVDSLGNVTVTTKGTGTGVVETTTTTSTTAQINQTSTTLKDPGGFIIYGLRDRKLMLQAGIGYFNGGKAQNVSWIGGALYFPQKLGLGLSYSPLTGIGLQVAFRF